MKDVTLVFPMHRAGVVMRSELQRRMAAEHPAAVWSPEMMALGDLFDSLCPLGKEDELFTVCRLHRIYTECLHEDPMEIDRFYGWGRQLLSDFTNIDQGISEAEIEAFFRNAITLSDLDTYKLDDEVRRRLEDLLYKGQARSQSLIADSVQAHFAALWKALPDIYHRLRNEMQQAGRGYEGQRMRYVVSHWPELRERATSRMYCFIGFNYLLPVERQLMQLLQDEERALFFWDYVEDFRTNTKAFAFIRHNMRTLPNALPPAVWGDARRVRTISATSLHSEAELAGQWLKDSYKQKGELTAIVICDEGQLEPVIYGLPPIRLSDNQPAEDINITKGYPLRNTPVFAEVVKRLSAISSQLSAISSQLSAISSQLAQVVAYIDEQSRITNNQNSQLSWQWHLRREALYQTRRTLIQFITILRDGLVSDLVNHPDLLMRLIRRHLEQITLPFHGEPVTDLQIMGVLETRTLDFKHLLMLNVEEGVIPAHQPDKSFLPYYLRKAYGLQTHDERASVYAYNFFRLLRRAEDVTLVFSQSQTAMTKKTMSRFVMQMIVCPEEFTVERYTLTESNTLRPARAIEIPADTSWAASQSQMTTALTIEGNDKSQITNKKSQLYLSPSAINTFYACKRKFYLQYMRNLWEEDEPEMIFSNRTLGLFVHEAVHYLYEHHCHCDNKQAVRIHPNQIAAVNTPEQRHEALLAAYERLNAAYMEEHRTTTPVYLSDRHQMENRVIDTYIEHVLNRDFRDADLRGLTILLLEQPLYTTINYQSPITNHQLPISIGGRLDRMDRVGGLNGLPEVTRIVDYKCGTYHPNKMTAKTDDLRTHERPDTDYVRQTLIYTMVAYEKITNNQSPITNHQSPISIEPHLYFTAQDLLDERTVTRVSLDKQPLTYDSTTHDDYQALVRGMIDDILAEREFPQCENCSPYCPFLRLCARTASKFV